jgi:spore maturation protein CgeB
MRSRMQDQRLQIVVIGLSITSSWGNGHATTYRALLRALSRRGHRILFLERDVPWYASCRDLPHPRFARTELYKDLRELKSRFSADVRDADVVMVGSYVPDGIEVGNWVVTTAKGLRAFYDIDTPVTLAALESGSVEYLSASLIKEYDLYLSFTGGSTLRRLEEEYGSPMARPLYCSVDPNRYYPEDCVPVWDLGYLGTYSEDRQNTLERLMIEPARRWNTARMIVAGSLYPDPIEWPPNIERIDHLRPAQHRRFYNRQRFTLNITRAAMVRAGYSPSVRLFEAAACGTAIISDLWEGLDEFFEIGREILVARCCEESLELLRELPEAERRALGQRAQARVLSEHTAERRAIQLEQYISQCCGQGSTRPIRSVKQHCVGNRERSRSKRTLNQPVSS